MTNINPSELHLMKPPNIGGFFVTFQKNNTMELLEKNWTQIAVMFAAIGWVIGHFIERAAKRKEVKFTLFEEKRAATTGDFLNAYFNIKEYFRNISDEEMMNRRLTGQDMDDRWNPVMNDLLNNYYKMHLYVSRSEIAPFYEIHKQVFELKKKLSIYYRNVSPLKSDAYNMNYQMDYWSGYTSFEKYCESKVFEICKNFRNQYGMI